MSQKPMFEVKCSECGESATVPFKPTAGKPVYCKSCYAKRRQKQQNASADASKKFNLNNAWAISGNNWQGKRREKHNF
jgi:CxxC-x17-CxxC domain-containing protein